MRNALVILSQRKWRVALEPEIIAGLGCTFKTSSQSQIGTNSIFEIICFGQRISHLQETLRRYAGRALTLGTV